MTIGVLWEFFEFGMDEMFGLDMQKDTVLVTGIASVLLDPEGLAAAVSHRRYPDPWWCTGRTWVWAGTWT